MKPLPNLQELRRVCVTLDEAQFFQFAYGHLRLHRHPHPAGREPLAIDSIVRIAVYEWLIAMAGLTEVEARNTVHHFSACFDTSSQWFDAADSIKTKLPTVTLSILDRTFASFSGVPRFYHFGYDLESQELEEPAVSLTVCNVTALYLRVLKWVDKLRGKDEPQHHAEEAGDAHETDRRDPGAS